MNEDARLINFCLYSPDGNYLATGSYNIVKIWKIKENIEVLTLKGQSKRINSCFFIYDGKYLVTESEDETIRIWKMKKGKSNFKMNNLSKVTIYNKTKNLRNVLKLDDYSITSIKKSMKYGLFPLVCDYNGTISVWNISEMRKNILLNYDTTKLIALYFIENQKYLVAVYTNYVYKIAYRNKLIYILDENLSRCIIQRKNIKLLFKDAKVATFIHNYYNQYNKSKFQIEEQLPLIVSKLILQFEIKKFPKIALDLAEYIVKFTNLNYRILHLNNEAHEILKNFYSQTLNNRGNLQLKYESQILMFLHYSIAEFDTKQLIAILLDHLIKL